MVWTRVVNLNSAWKEISAQVMIWNNHEIARMGLLILFLIKPTIRLEKFNPDIIAIMWGYELDNWLIFQTAYYTPVYIKQ